MMHLPDSITRYTVRLNLLRPESDQVRAQPLTLFPYYLESSVVSLANANAMRCLASQWLYSSSILGMNSVRVPFKVRDVGI